MAAPASYKIAVAATTVYLLLSMVAWTLPLLAKDDDLFTLLFLILVSLPWIIALVFVTRSLGIDSLIFNFAFCLAAILLNAALIYVTMRFFTKRHRTAKGVHD